MQPLGKTCSSPFCLRKAHFGFCCLACAVCLMHPSLRPEISAPNSFWFSWLHLRCHFPGSCLDTCSRLGSLPRVPQISSASFVRSPSVSKQALEAGAQVPRVCPTAGLGNNWGGKGGMRQDCARSPTSPGHHCQEEEEKMKEEEEEEEERLQQQ